MTLAEYCATQPRGAKKRLAIRLGITSTWMSLLISGKRSPSVDLAIRIERETDRFVTRRDLLPKVFGA